MDVPNTGAIRKERRASKPQDTPKRETKDGTGKGAKKKAGRRDSKNTEEKIPEESKNAIRLGEDAIYHHMLDVPDQDVDSAENLRLEFHYQAEHEALHQLLKLEKEFKDFYQQTIKYMKLQREIIDRMWVLSQRYMNIVSTGPCGKYPEIYIKPNEAVLLREYTTKLANLRTSNDEMMSYLGQLRKSCKVFEAICAKLDMTIKSKFVAGDTFHKPITYFIELVRDLFKYFHAQRLKFNYSAHELDPADCAQLEIYKALLVTNEEFEEYLLVGLSYCKCLQPTNLPCPPESYEL